MATHKGKILPAVVLVALSLSWDLVVQFLCCGCYLNFSQAQGLFCVNTVLANKTITLQNNLETINDSPVYTIEIFFIYNFKFLLLSCKIAHWVKQIFIHAKKSQEWILFIFLHFYIPMCGFQGCAIGLMQYLDNVHFLFLNFKCRLTIYVTFWLFR